MDKDTIGWPIILDCMCGNTPAIFYNTPEIYPSERFYCVACEHCKRTGIVSTDKLSAINMWNEAIKIETRDREEKDAHLRILFAGRTRYKEESEDCCMRRAQPCKEENDG